MLVLIHTQPGVETGPGNEGNSTTCVFNPKGEVVLFVSGIQLYDRRFNGIPVQFYLLFILLDDFRYLLPCDRGGTGKNECFYHRQQPRPVYILIIKHKFIYLISKIGRASCREVV